MLNVAVVEDESEYRSMIQDMIMQYAEEHRKQIKVTAFSDGSGLVENYRKEYDIILLDIEMPQMNGMKAAEEIRRQDQDVVLVFITNMAQYAIRGYEVDALDFILKPLNYYTFSMRFMRAIGRVKIRESRQVCLVLDDGVKKLDSREIYYIEIQNRMLHYHTEDGEFSVRGTLKQAMEELEGYHFVKCNHWYLVNLRHVSEIRKNIVIVAGNELEISRRNRTAFLAAVTEYMGENV